MSEGSVRLADGDTETEGRVEVFIQGHWYSVCDDFWSNSDAKVVCNQLGFLHAIAEATYRASFGSGEGNIAMDNVNCQGDESRLFSCSHNGFFEHNCLPSEHAGVICGCMSIYMYITSKV